jgi:hypothetical protein
LQALDAGVNGWVVLVRTPVCERVALAKQPQTAVEIVAELISGL